MVVLIALSIFILLVCFLGLWIVLHKKSVETQKSLENSFKSLSFEIFEKNSRIFLDFAKTSLEKYQEGAKHDLESRQKAIDETLKPFNESLKQLDTHQRELEKRREGAYSSLTKQVEGMVIAEKELRRETAQLVQALRSPQMRGSWGEVHLRRVVELAGLLNNCDFFEQKSIDTDGKIWRPDLVIRLPGQRYIAVDAKTPISSYLDASDAGDDILRKKKLQDHALALRKHIKDLSAKEYWKQLESAPEYVILFLPAEAFYSAALQSDPTLIEVGADQNIIVATPTTLIAILRAVAFSWKQDSLSKSAKEISRLGQELYDRIGIVCDHWNKVGRNLNTAVDAYNQSVASMEARVLVTARKLKESGSISSEMIEPSQIDKLARSHTVIMDEKPLLAKASDEL
jgi:DNA recombination protein RmuC